MVLAPKLLMEESRMWPDRPLAMIELDMRKAFDQLYRSNVACVAPEVTLGLMRPMAGGKSDASGGRCCQEERGRRQSRPESMDFFFFVLCYCTGLLVEKWCGQGFCVDGGGKPFGSLGILR